MADGLLGTTYLWLYSPDMTAIFVPDSANHLKRAKCWHLSRHSQWYFSGNATLKADSKTCFAETRGRAQLTELDPATQHKAMFPTLRYIFGQNTAVSVSMIQRELPQKSV